MYTIASGINLIKLISQQPENSVDETLEIMLIVTAFVSILFCASLYISPSSQRRLGGLRGDNQTVFCLAVETMRYSVNNVPI